MFLYILLFTVLSIVLFYYVNIIYTKWCGVRGFWEERGVPHKRPNFILGSLTFVTKENINLWLKGESDHFKPSPYFGMWLFWKPVLVVCTPELARQVLVKDFDNFRNRYSTGSSKDPTNWNMFLVKDPFWTLVRKKLNHCFSTAKLKAMDELRIRKSKEIVTRIQRDVQRNKINELKDMFADLSTDLLVGTAFGVQENATLSGDSDMRKVTRSFTHFPLSRGIQWAAIFYFPALAEIFGFDFFPRKDVIFFKKVFDRVTQLRGGWQKQNDDTKDIFDSLMQMKRKSVEEGEEVTDNQILAQAILFLQAGYETTAVGLSYLFMELAFHPEYQKRLYEEVLKAKQNLDGNDFDVDTISELPFLKAVVKETLRKYPALAFLDRESMTDYKVDENLTIPAGTPVYVNVYSLHYNEDYFEAPYKFLPERFLPENKHKILPYTYMPFGLGPRGCIAFRMGLLTMYMVTAYVLLAFEVRPRPGGRRPDDLPINPNTMLVIPDADMEVDFVPRNL